MVTPYYNPLNMDNTGLPQESVEETCYSLWLFENDITHLHTSIVATIHTIGRIDESVAGRVSKEKAVDGYACDTFDGHMYHSELDPQNFLEIEFPMYVCVTKVFVKTRTVGPYMRFFVNMEVRVGNYSGLGSVGLNTKIGNTVTSTVESELVTFDATSSPVVGKYVIIRQVAPSDTGRDHLIIPEMKIIGRVI